MRKDERLCGNKKRSKRRDRRVGSCVFLRLGDPDGSVFLVNIVRRSRDRGALESRP